MTPLITLQCKEKGASFTFDDKDYMTHFVKNPIGCKHFEVKSRSKPELADFIKNTSGHYDLTVNEITYNDIMLSSLCTGFNNQSVVTLFKWGE